MLNAEGIDCRYILCGVSRNEAVNRLNNSALEGKGIL